jgi:uncharacterized protein YoaH (UPF0181 family)
VNHYERRLRCLEAWRQRREIAAMAAEHGSTYDQFMEEAEAFFALSLEEQLAKVDEIADALRAEGMSWGDVDELKATLIREYRP